jgi:hypothetical protein
MNSYYSLFPVSCFLHQLLTEKSQPQFLTSIMHSLVFTYGPIYYEHDHTRWFLTVPAVVYTL